MNSVTWDLASHTEGKHIILRHYLKAWYRIVGSRFPKIFFLDGYAGPGEYSKGEDGSPIIALREAMNFLDYCDSNRIAKPEIHMKFIEKDPNTFEFLTKKISGINIKKEIKIDLVNSTFEDAGTDVEAMLLSKEFKGMPSFLFIDPFGYNLSFELLQKLMNCNKCEVFINFMYEFVNRFMRRAGQEQVLTRLFGGDEWRRINEQTLSPGKRKQAIQNLYQSQLEKHAATYVRSFEMKGDRGTTKYFLYYGTNHRLGLEKMKEAMWKIDKSGSFSFSDATDPDQLVLFGDKPDYQYLKGLILQEFKNRPVSIEAIEDFVICKTPFLKTHFKNSILSPMEKMMELTVLESPRSTKRGYPNGTIIKFNELNTCSHNV